MITYHHNGEGWYCNRSNLLARTLRWICWPGGWETVDGWRLFRRIYWTHKGKPTRPLRFCDPYPLSFFGHHLTFFSGWMDAKIGRKTWLVISWKHKTKYAYISSDGTPNQAQTWLWGAPREVIRAAEERQRFHDERRAQYNAKATRQDFMEHPCPECLAKFSTGGEVPSA